MLSGVFSSRATCVRAVSSFLSLAIVFAFFFLFSGRPAKANPTVTFAGFHDGADCSSIFGWAWDSTQPNTPINVDIFADDVLITTAPANFFRQDLLDAGIGNGVHAFNIATPVNLIDGQPHTIRVKISGSSITLANSPRALNCVLFEGFLDVADCNVIGGWAWNSTQPDTPIDVDFFIDNDSFASVRAPANQFRQDLLDAGKGNGVHAYIFATPAFLKDGQPHSIHVKFRGTTQELQTSPRTINCGDVTPAFQGFHDAQDCSFIYGWAWDSNSPNAIVSVDIYRDSTLIATVPANQFRQDLLNAGIGNGNHAFMFATPASVKDGQTHKISIGFHLTDTALSNTFQNINCPP